MNKLFGNSGKKIKLLSIISFIGISLLGIIIGIVMSIDDDAIFLLFIPLSPLAGWLINLFIYSYGEIVDRICRIEQKISDNGNQNVETPSTMKQNNNSSKKTKLDSLLTQGLITEEEYNQALSNQINREDQL